MRFFMVISKIFPYFCATVYVCTYRIIFMTPQPDNQYAVGADVGGSHVCSSVIDITTGEQVTKPFSTALDSKAGAAEIMAILAENIRTSAGMVPHGHVAGAALAFPGPFDYIHGVSIVNGVGKYERIYGLDIASSLRSRLGGFGIRDFRFLNDASAFALGEYVSGAAAGTHRAVAITLGTGVGSGFVADGHLVEEGDEVPASGWVYHLPFEDGIADEAFSTRWICRRYRELTGKAVSGAKDVADRFHSGEAAAGELFKEYGLRLAEFAAPILSKFRAEILVLGGNISRAYGIFGPFLEKGLAKAGCKTTVCTSALLDNAAMIGGATLFR